MTEVSLGRLRALRRRGGRTGDPRGGDPAAARRAGQRRARWSRSRTRTGCSRRPSTPSRRSGAGCRYRRSCAPETTAGSPGGGATRPCCGPPGAAPTCSPPCPPKPGQTRPGRASRGRISDPRPGIWQSRGVAAYAPRRRDELTPPACLLYLRHALSREEAAAMNTLDALDAQSQRTDIPDFRAGDTLKVHARVVEGNRSRIQIFQGVVIRRQGAGLRETFTVRKVSFGVGVERTYPVNSPRTGPHRGRDPRRRPPRQALLPARAARQGGQDQGEAGEAGRLSAAAAALWRGEHRQRGTADPGRFANLA